MSSFALTSGTHYVNSLNVVIAKSGERKKNFEILQNHIPWFLQRLSLLTRPCVNVLSVGSGMGKRDVDILQNTKEELQKVIKVVT